jgi:hypothetical protein
MGLPSIVRQPGSAEGWDHIPGAVRAVLSPPIDATRSTAISKFRESSPPSRLTVFERCGIVLEGTAIDAPPLPLKPCEVGRIGTGMCAIKVRETGRLVFRKSENGADLSGSLFCAVLGRR